MMTPISVAANLFPGDGEAFHVAILKEAFTLKFVSFNKPAASNSSISRSHVPRQILLRPLCKSHQQTGHFALQGLDVVATGKPGKLLLLDSLCLFQRDRSKERKKSRGQKVSSRKLGLQSLHKVIRSIGMGGSNVERMIHDPCFGYPVFSLNPRKLTSCVCNIKHSSSLEEQRSTKW